MLYSDYAKMFINKGIIRYMSNIAFIGLGNMGSKMAKNLLTKGEKLIIYDIEPANLKPFENNENVIIANNLGDTVRKSTKIITMLPDNYSVWSVYTDENGLLTNCSKENSVFVDSSTIDPKMSIKISLLAKEKGFSFLEAPVSGGVISAKNGSLTFMVGGCEKDLQNIKPILLKMGCNIIYCGANGMGQTAKLCNNMLLATTMLAVAEAMNLGIKTGLDKKVLANVINSSSGKCWSSELYNPVPGIIESAPSNRNYKDGFKTKLLLKDIKLALKLAEDTDSFVLLLSEALKIYEDSLKYEFGDLDFSVIYQYIAKNKNT